MRWCRVLAMSTPIQALAFACTTNVTRQAVGHAIGRVSMLPHSFWREVHDDQVHVSGFGGGKRGREIVQCNMAALQTWVGARAAHAAWLIERGDRW
jgi:hypothetical protein